MISSTMQRSLLALLGVCLLPLAPVFAQPVPTVEEVTEKVINAEAQLGYITVKHFVGRRVVRDEKGDFVATPLLVEGSVTYEGVVGGKFIADVTEVLPYVRDESRREPDSWITTASSKSYDGTSGRTVYHPIPEKKEGRGWTREAKIAAKSPLGAPKNLQSASDGSAATLGFFMGYMRIGAEKKEYLLGSHLKKLNELGAKLVVAAERIDGIDLIKVSDPSGSAYWFEPGRGYALRRAISGAPRGGVASPGSTLVVEELTSLNDTTWYPTRGYWGDPTADGNLSRKWEFTVSGVTMSDTPPASFVATIPEGYLVDDMITGDVYKSAGAMADSIPTAPASIPPSTPPLLKRPPSTSSADPSVAASTGMSKVAMVLGIVAGLIVLTAFVYWQRKR